MARLNVPNGSDLDTPQEALLTLEERLDRWRDLMRRELAVPEVILALRWPVVQGNLVIYTPEGMADGTVAALLEGAAGMLRAGRHELHPR